MHFSTISCLGNIVRYQRSIGLTTSRFPIYTLSVTSIEFTTNDLPLLELDLI